MPPRKQQKRAAEEAAQLEEAPAPVTADKGKQKAVEEEPVADDAAAPKAPAMTMAERMAKMKQLQGKMAASSRANRKDLILEQKKAKEPVIKKDASNSRKLAKAERLLDERDILERGEDIERNRNWQYSIEDSERWEERLEEKEEIRDKGAVDYQTAAERTYKRQIRDFKPNISAYQASKSGQAHVGPSSASSTALIARNQADGQQLISRADLDSAYSHMSYGDHKPNDADVDRLVSHLNMEQVQRSKRTRKREDDPDAEVTYINETNRKYNNRLNRFYDKYTQEIRENFERGTAL